jgi:trehalose-6-phosphatase
MSNDSKPDEAQASAKPEADDAEGFDDTEDEFRALYQRCEETKADLLRLANRMAQKSPNSADVLRQVAGNVVQLLQDTVASCGGAFEDVEERLADEDDAGGSAGLDEEDAVDFYRTMLANLRLVETAVQASEAGDQREGLEALQKMNEEMRDRVVELSGLEAEELQKLAEKEPEPEAPSEADPAKAN